MFHFGGFLQALDRCKAVEAKIEKMMHPIDDLRKEAQTEFEKVNPTYYAALEALASLNIADFFEVRSFTSPPKGVVMVMKAVCLLFDVEQT